jgi:16S rRNA (uracil1498-N3)-methyltransferase
MTRFFIPSRQFEENTVILQGDDAHHLLKVLRKKAGDEFTVLNGKGREFLARIKEIGPDSVIAELVEEITAPGESKVQINLVQSLPKADKFEWIIQKNTEIGVSRFQPVISERSAIKLDPVAAVKKGERWNKIIKEAAEQSGRKVIPELETVREWSKALPTLGRGLVLIPWEGESRYSLKQALEESGDFPETVTIIIGPEGGFSLNEVDQAREIGAVPVTLGTRILRTETAGLVVSSIILYHFGCLG